MREKKSAQYGPRVGAVYETPCGKLARIVEKLPDGEWELAYVLSSGRNGDQLTLTTAALQRMQPGTVVPA